MFFVCLVLFLSYMVFLVVFVLKRLITLSLKPPINFLQAQEYFFYNLSFPSFYVTKKHPNFKNKNNIFKAIQVISSDVKSFKAIDKILITYITYIIYITLITYITHIILYSYHVTYAFQSELTLYSCVNVKELLARGR